MSLNPAKIALAVQGGLSIVCSTCTKYWEGRDVGLPGDTCTAKTPCGSPLAGDDFHEYRGPISEFSGWCFICGDDPSCAIQHPGSARLFGVCERHKQALPNLVPVNMVLPQGGGPIVTLANGEKRTLGNLLPQTKPSIFQVIAETEAEFTRRDMERGLIPPDENI